MQSQINSSQQINKKKREHLWARAIAAYVSMRTVQKVRAAASPVLSRLVVAVVLVFCMLTKYVSAGDLSESSSTSTSATTSTSSPATSSYVEIAVPDLADMLYPSRNKQIVAFGASGAARVFKSFNVATSSGGCINHAFCLMLVFTSVFDFDPFLLTKYESKFPINSPVFDGLPVDFIQPAVIGNSGPTNESDAGYDPEKPLSTVWIFQTDFRNNDFVPTIDLLLRMKQQSQWRSRKDQLMIHVTTKLPDAHSASCAIESFSLYGNQRVTHSTQMIDTNQMRIDIHIEQNTSQRNVIAADAYPLARLSNATNQRWTYQQQATRECAALLYDCTADDISSGFCDYTTSSAPLIQCLRETRGLNQSWFLDLLGLDVGTTAPIFSHLAQCFASLQADESSQNLPHTQRKWWNATVAMSCMANHRSPFGPFNSIFYGMASKMIELTNTTLYRHTFSIPVSNFTGQLHLTFGNGSDGGYFGATSNLTASSSEMDFVNAIESVLGNMQQQDVIVTKVFNGSSWTIQISYINVLFPVFVSSFHVEETEVDENQDMESFSVLNVTEMDFSRLTPVQSCKNCLNLLDLCQADTICRTTVLPCVIEQLEKVSNLTGEYYPKTGSNRIDVLSLLKVCAMNVSIPPWNPIRESLSCLSRYQCPVGTTSTTAGDEALASMLSLENGRQVFAIAPQPNSTQIALTIIHEAMANSTKTFMFNGSSEHLAAFIYSFVLETAGDIAQSQQTYAQDSDYIEITLEYSNYLSDLPVIRAENIILIENDAVHAYIDYPDSTAGPSLTILLQELYDRVADPSILFVSPNHTWILSEECLHCSTRLYNCSADAVANHTCYYSGMTNGFGGCLLKKLPTATYQMLLAAANESYSMSTMGIETELFHCAEEATASIVNATNSLNMKASISSALSCFTMTGCPFGPLDLVQETSMIQLGTSSYIHLLLIYAKAFHLTLEFKFGTASLASITFDNTISKSLLASMTNSALLPTGIKAVVPLLWREVGGTRWLLEIQYQNVFLSDFKVIIAEGSQPTKSAIEQFVIEASPQLVVTSRNNSKVFHSSESFHNDVGSQDTSSSGSAGSAGSSSRSSDAGFARSAGGSGSTGSVGSASAAGNAGSK